MLTTGPRTYSSEIARLEALEWEMWERYRRLDADCRHRKGDALKAARKRAVGAHRDHSRVLGRIHKLHTDEIFEGARLG